MRENQTDSYKGNGYYGAQTPCAEIAQSNLQNNVIVISVLVLD